MSLVIAGPSPPVPEPLVMCTHHRRFVSGTVGDGYINTAGLIHEPAVKTFFPSKKYFHIIILHHLYNIYNI